jgi:hypothetical protein
MSEEDAVGFEATAVASIHANMVLQGAAPGHLCSTSFKMEVPKTPRSGSFFEQQKS